MLVRPSRRVPRCQPGSRLLLLTKSVVAFTLAATFLATRVLAQELPGAEDSFEVEPPLLVPPDEPEPEQLAIRSHKLPVTRETLKKELEHAEESAASAERLVKLGVLAKTEAEQRALRVIGLEAELANAELGAAKEQVEAGKKRLEAGEIGKDELDALTVALARANAAAEAARAAYQQAQLDAAALNLRRQKQLLAVGSARKSDVARAEEKLATLQRGEERER